LKKWNNAVFKNVYDTKLNKQSEIPK